MILRGSVSWFEKINNPQIEFTVHGIGYYEKMEPCIVNRPKGTGDCLLMLFHDTVQVKCEGIIQEVNPGSMILWDTSMGHFYGSEMAQWRHSWLHCGGVSQELMRESSLPLDQPIVNLEELFLTALKELCSERMHPEYSSVILLNLFKNLLIRIQRNKESSKLNRAPDRLLEAKLQIERAYTKKLCLKELAKVSHFSESHFSAEFKKWFGLAPLQYQTQLRMKDASYLLKNINLSITEIAERVGYPDIYHFSKQFKKFYQKSPSYLR